MSVEDFKIAVYNTSGSTVLSQLTVKTDGNIEASHAYPAASKDLITKEFADSEYATDVHNHDNRYFQETEFVDESAGTADAGKPIILDGNGLVSDTMIDVATFIYQGNWTPIAGTEYPNNSGLEPGAFWTIDGLTGDYTFTSGDLAGETITNDDLLIWGTEGWAMTKRDEDLSVYYKLDGSRAITGNFAGGGFQVKNIADATDSSDAMTKGQADLAYAPSGIGGGDFYADGHVPMRGNLNVGGFKLLEVENGVADTDGVNVAQLKNRMRSAGRVVIDCNDVLVTGSAGTSPVTTNLPAGVGKFGTLLVQANVDVGSQIYIECAGEATSNRVFSRIWEDSGALWGDWTELGGSGRNISVGFDAVGGILASVGVSSVISTTGNSQIFYSEPMINIEYYVTGAVGGAGGAGDDDEDFFNLGGINDYTVDSCKVRSVHASDNSTTEEAALNIFRAYHPGMASVSEIREPLLTDDVGVIEDPDLTIRILNPAIGWQVQECFDLTGFTGNIMDRSNLPESTIFRSAWRLDSVANTIYIDVEKAKEIVIGENEKVTKLQLEALRPAFEEAYDTDDQFTLDLVKVDRQNIRNNLTIRIANINACTTAAQVEAYLP